MSERERTCPNCNVELQDGEGGHFMPPCLGDEGMWGCETINKFNQDQREAEQVTPPQAQLDMRLCLNCGKPKHLHYLQGDDPILCRAEGEEVFRYGWLDRELLAPPQPPVARCVHCGEPIMDNGTVYVHLRVTSHGAPIGHTVVVQDQWCDLSRDTFAETADMLNNRIPQGQAQTPKEKK